MKTVTEYDVKILYDTGAEVVFQCLDFSIKQSHLSNEKVYNWTGSPNSKNLPLVLGANNIIAVWQIGSREIEIDETDQAED